MDKNRVEGTMKDVKGKVERKVGEWTDDASLQGEGLKDQAAGKIQNTYGKAKDKVRDIADDVKEHTDKAAEPAKDSGDRYFDKTKRSA